MGITSDLGIDGLVSGFAFGTIGIWALIIFICFIILFLAGIITFFYYWKKAQKVQYKNKIPMFQSINGKRTRIGIDTAKEVFIPDSNISLFFLRGRKIYIARPTRAMAKDEYWYSISENGEWVNFDLSVDPEKDTLSQANYDHRDTRYAFVNLKDLIKKNYKDKAIQWWKDPVIMNIIAFIIMSFIFIGGCWFLLSKIASIITQLGPIAETMREITENQVAIATESVNSGVISNG